MAAREQRRRQTHHPPKAATTPVDGVRYDLIRPELLEALARRLHEGAEKYLDGENYLLGVRDAGYRRERFNHAFRHLAMWMSGDSSDDHLAALLWWVQMELVAAAAGDPASTPAPLSEEARTCG